MMTDEVSGQMGECRLCRRSFFVEKLAKHEKVCPGIKVQTGKKVKNVGCATVNRIRSPFRTPASRDIKRARISRLMLRLLPYRSGSGRVMRSRTR